MRVLVVVVVVWFALAVLGNKVTAGSVYAKSGAQGVTAEVVSVEGGFCDEGSQSYVVRNVGQTETWALVVNNGPSYSVGSRICIGSVIGDPPCSGGGVSVKYDLLECGTD